MVINHNIASMNAQSSLYTSNYHMQKSIEKLSTGLRINRASDDAAGLSVSENLRAQVRGLQMADRNAQDGISAMQIAEGALNEVSAILQRMREISVESATETYTNTDRGYLNQEFAHLSEEITRITKTTEFNGIKLLDGSWKDRDLQVGSNNSTDDRLTTSITSINAISLGIAIKTNAAETAGAADATTAANSTTGAQVAIHNKTFAQQAITELDEALDTVNQQRSKIGSYVNRLEHTVANLKNSALNMQAAESQIRDTDVGNEMANFTKLQILSQAGTSMLGQANQVPQQVMSLFQ